MESEIVLPIVLVAILICALSWVVIWAYRYDKAVEKAYQRWLDVLKEKNLVITKDGKEQPNFALMQEEITVTSTEGGNMSPSLGFPFRTPKYETLKREFVYRKEYEYLQNLLEGFKKEELKKRNNKT